MLINKKTECLLTLCIPTYNRAQYLNELLNSIESQLTKLVEIVICDNHSTDNTVEIISAAIDRGMPIRFIRHEANLGPDRNFISCISNSITKYCWFIGSDDVLERDAIENVIVTILKFQPTALIVNKRGYSSDLKTPRITYNPMGSSKSRIITSNSPRHIVEALAANFGYIGLICVERNAWNSVIAEKYIGTAYVHVYILQKLLKDGYPFYYLDKPCLRWRFDNDSILAESKALGRLDIEINYIRISKVVFTSDGLSRGIARRIIIHNIFWQIMTYKIGGVFVQEMRSLLFRELKNILIFYITVLPVSYFPGWTFRILRLIYRATLKPIRVILNKLS